MAHHCGMLSPLSSVTSVALTPTASPLPRLVTYSPVTVPRCFPLLWTPIILPRIPRSRSLPHVPPEQGREHDVIPTCNRPLGPLVLLVFFRHRYDSPRLTSLRTV